MIYKSIVSCKLFLFFSLLILTACGEQRQAELPERVRLTVAMDDDMPGYFVFGGENYGYQYDLFKAYADYRGLELQVVQGLSASERSEKLALGELDFVTALTARIAAAEAPASVPIYNTSYVLLADKSRAAAARKAKHFNLSSFVGDGRVLISSGFKKSKTYGMLLDSLSSAAIYVSSRNSFEMLEALGDGQYDYLICEMSEAQLGCALSKNVEQVYTFAEPVSLSAVVSPRDEGLRQDFEAWLNRFRNSEEYAMLNYLYFEKGIVRQVVGRGLASSRAGRISAFDKLFKEICEKEGYDWRFVAAIAYNESRFNPFLVSSRGAQGLMQIMPRVARQFDVQGNVMDPENNVLLAVKILGKIEKSLRFAPGTSEMDRMKIVLACYNGGIGHVTDARNLARKYGANPDSWNDVSEYLTLKSDPQYARDEVVRNGRFVGRQTLAFVRDVISRYSVYCRNVSR